MMCLLFIGLYYLVGMTISAWMVKSKIIWIEGGRDNKNRYRNEGDWEACAAYFLVPLFWPLLVVWQILCAIAKVHVIIHTILVHATNVLNMRITKDGGDTVIRFHLPKKSEL